MNSRIGASGRFAGAFIHSKLTPLFILFSLFLGVFAVIVTPREEEPQIIVPMIDIVVGLPGATPQEVEERLIRPLEKLLWEIPGVEYLYSTSSPEHGMVIVRFRVGEDLERSIVKINEKLEHHKEQAPQGTIGPFVKNRSIDDVPIMTLTFWSATTDHYQLRRVAAQVSDEIKAIDDVSEVTLTGGTPRTIRVEFDPSRLAGFNMSSFELISALRAANTRFSSGRFTQNDREVLVETGNFFKSAEDVGRVTVGQRGGRPVLLGDVAHVIDGPGEPDNYVFIDFGTHTKSIEAETTGKHPDIFEGKTNAAVTLSIAKRQGTNAITVTHAVDRKIEELKERLIPESVHVQTTRNYGETSAEKSNELLFHMMLATLSVATLILISLGWRESGVVATAIPVTLALTLLFFYLWGYTLNRITLFALIFSIGILVDDAIVVVENMVRHFSLRGNAGRDPAAISIEAVDEVGNPTILATATVIAAILPMAFVRGLMGPYMRPIPIGASAAMLFSLLVAFVVTPWAALRFLKFSNPEATDSAEDSTGATPITDTSKNPGHGVGHTASDDWTTRLYRRMMHPLIDSPRVRKVFLVSIILLLLAAASMVPLRLVKIKMLPFDNKSEFQVIIDTPEGTTLERTAEVARTLTAYLTTVPEVVNVESYVGINAPYNFNGLVRHYFLRSGANVADLQVNLLGKDDRKRQSHEIAVSVRPELQKIATRFNANIKVAEVPPGPPVLETIVAEIYGPDHEGRIALASQVSALFRDAPGVVDIDTYTEDDQRKITFSIDQEKAARLGLTVEAVAQTLRLGVDGVQASLMHLPREKEDVPILVRLPRSARSGIETLLNLKMTSPTSGRQIPLSEIARPIESIEAKSRYHKNLKSAVYVVADVAGVEESPVYPILGLMQKVGKIISPDGGSVEQWNTRLPDDTSRYAIKWDGEWHITYEVFRDLGFAFAIVMVLIYILVTAWFQNFLTPFTIMAPIPLTLVGILPAHYLFGAFFTATSMIGFIAGAGIIVRNSIILVDFIHLKLDEGLPLSEAVVEAGAVRFRPMLLTAAAVVAGAGVILFDPIFQGLAISLMAGEIASTLLARITVPVLFYMEASREHVTGKITHKTTNRAE
ncbi:MAG: efflux RND transporter permease subunit [Candidatus Riflebacteria bacterium]|nr:efflux RND transporter permease subunit [Candidatus Riflebacteria bacterium]